MLAALSIRNIVIIDALSVAFGRGLTVLTGETGAGKSILIDALGLLLGGRGDGAMVRAGARQAEMSGKFDLAQAPAASEWIARAGLEGDPDVCLVRRIVDAGGRSRAFVNGHPATVAQLRELGEMLVDIHGQHAHQSLLRPASQRALLDDYAGAADLAAEVAQAFRTWSDLAARHEAALRDADRLMRERDQLGWQVSELSRLEFDPQAWQELNAEHGRLTHAASLIETASQAIDALSEDEHSASRLVNGVVARLTRAAELDPSLGALVEVLETASIQIGEAVHGLEHYRARLEVDPQRLAQIESRMQAVHDALRKFRLTPQTLLSALDEARQRLDALDHDLDLGRLERETAEALAAYRQAAGKLTQARRKAALRLGRQVSAAIQDLALAGGRFEAALEKVAEPGPHGMERVEFRVAAHAGLEPGPLGKVASGGELSRLSLAIQTVLSQVAQVPTLIFDEVDAGIGGRVAQIVGQMLHRLGSRHQVMCVTHLAQVAACADEHWRVVKEEQGGQVTSRVDALDAGERVQEIARMLSGLTVTRATLDHASELLREAARPAAVRD